MADKITNIKTSKSERIIYLSLNDDIVDGDVVFEDSMYSYPSPELLTKLRLLFG